MAARIPTLTAKAVIVVILAAGATVTAAGIADERLEVWGQTDKVTPNDADEPGAFGYPSHSFVGFGSSLAIDEGLMAVGTSFDACEEQGMYSAYAFRRGNGSFIQEARLRPGDESHDHGKHACRGFGNAVAVDGERGVAVVGDPGFDRQDQKDVGSAYVYQRTANGSWAREARLTVDVQGDDQGAAHGPAFGDSVAISGDTIAIGAPHAYDSRGAIHILEETDGGWGVQQEIKGELGPGAHTGLALGLDDDTLAIGASGANRAIVFAETDGGWKKAQELSPPEDELPKSRTRTCFGFSVDVDGDRLAVGEPCWETALEDYGDRPYSGRAHVFDRSSSGWEREASLTAEDGTEGEMFGNSVAVEDTIVAVGARHAPTYRTHDGRAYLFEEGEEGWEQTARLVSNETSPYDMFGFSVDVTESRAVVGAPLDDNRRDGVPYPLDDEGWLPPPLGTDGKGAGSVYAFGPDLSVSVSR